MPKGTSKVMFWGLKWRHGLPSIDLSSDFWCGAKKSSFLNAFPMDQKIDPWSGKGSKKVPQQTTAPRTGRAKGLKDERTIDYHTRRWTKGPANYVILYMNKFNRFAML